MTRTLDPLNERDKNKMRILFALISCPVPRPVDWKKKTKQNKTKLATQLQIVTANPNPKWPIKNQKIKYLFKGNKNYTTLLKKNCVKSESLRCSDKNEPTNTTCNSEVWSSVVGNGDDVLITWAEFIIRVKMQVNSCCQSNGLNPVCVNWMVSFGL